MKINKLIILILPVVLVAGVVLVLAFQSGSFFSGQKKLPTAPQISPEPVISTQTVPLPSEENIISLFFSLIDEGRIDEAIGMMSPEVVPNEASKQAWKTQFEAIQSINPQAIQAYNREQWTGKEHLYQVTLAVSVSEKAAHAPIPYYGWRENSDTRWITLKKNQEGQWQIASLATGP
jgi:hypothetical protein